MTYITDKQLCVNEDRSAIVPCDSPEAAMTLALPGVELSDEVAEKYGLLKPEQKAVTTAPANKAVQPKGKK